MKLHYIQQDFLVEEYDVEHVENPNILPSMD